MSKHLKHQILKKYKEIPPSLVKVLDSDDMYFTGLRDTLFNRKKTTIDRYVDVARVVFGFFEHLYAYMDEMSTLEKIKLVLFKSQEQTAYWDELFRKSAEVIDAELKACKCKGGKHEILDLHDEIYDTLEARGHDIKRFKFAGEHFKKKILGKKHMMFTENLVAVFGKEVDRETLEHLTRYWLYVETMIHGIDDYVDEQKRTKEEAGADIYNILFGLFGLTHALIQDQKIEIREMLNLLLGREPSFERFLRDMVYQMTEMTDVPYVEKRVLGILKTDDEQPLARENMDVRASGIGVFLKLTRYLLRKEEDEGFDRLCEMVKIHRIMQLLRKDIPDIPDDMKNKDYKAATAWAIKHGRKSKKFKEQMNTIADYYAEEAKEIYREMKTLRKAGKKCLQMIEERQTAVKEEMR